MSLQEKLQPLVTQWLEWDENAATRSEIEKLRDEGNWEELEKRLGTKIQFGTAGLRGRMQAGFSSMNFLTVISASQGIAEYMLESMDHKSPSDLSVLIGHDTRHHSKEFAKVAATAFSRKGIRVLLYEDYVPTPFVSFGVNHFKANAGVMVTASHNPKWDNGYKVYWSNGCQINTPTDQYIAASIRKHEKPWPNAFEMLSKPYPFEGSKLREQVLSAYLERLTVVCSEVTKSRKQAADKSGNAALSKFNYTPLHGVGYFVMEKISSDVLDWGMKVVKEQKDPDPEFPTVAFPNPEEPGALDAAFASCDETQGGKTVSIGHTIIANDPDADRLAVAERVGDVKQFWHKFTGDQLGILLASYLIEREAASGSDQKIGLLSSAVSSGMLKKLVKTAGDRFRHEETLTGFKWIGNQARNLTSQGFKVIFGYEEALGYMIPDISWDKDGLAAATLYLSAREHWASQGLTPYKKLLKIYDSIGYHESINTYFRSPSPATTNEFFDKLRSVLNQNPTLDSMPFDKWRDVTKGHAVGTWANQLQDSGSQMITCVVVPDANTPESKVTFTIRGSGTEPKIKIYLEASSSSESTANSQAILVLRTVVEEWVKKLGPTLTYTPDLLSSSGRAVSI